MSSQTVEQLDAHLQRRVGGAGRRQRQGGQLRAPLPRGPAGTPAAAGSTRSTPSARRSSASRPTRASAPSRTRSTWPSCSPRPGSSSTWSRSASRTRSRARSSSPPASASSAPEGKELEREIGRVGREGGTRVIGPNCIGLFNPKAGVITYPQVLMKGIPMEPGSVGRLLAERLVRRLPRVVPGREGPALQHHRELRQRVRPGRRGLPRVLRPGRADEDDRRLHGGRQGRPPLLRGGPRGRPPQADHPVEGRHERAGRQGGRLAHRRAGRLGEHLARDVQADRHHRRHQRGRGRRLRRRVPRPAAAQGPQGRGHRRAGRHRRRDRGQLLRARAGTAGAVGDARSRACARCCRRSARRWATRPTPAWPRCSTRACTRRPSRSSPTTRAST